MPARDGRVVVSLSVANQPPVSILPALVFVSGFTESSVRSLMESDPYAKEIEVDLVSVTSDEITLSLDVTDRLTNFLGLATEESCFRWRTLGCPMPPTFKKGLRSPLMPTWF
jgi:hypothetical protein